MVYDPESPNTQIKTHFTNVPSFRKNFHRSDIADQANQFPSLDDYRNWIAESVAGSAQTLHQAMRAYHKTRSGEMHQYLLDARVALKHAILRCLGAELYDPISPNYRFDLDNQIEAAILEEVTERWRPVPIRLAECVIGRLPASLMRTLLSPTGEPLVFTDAPRVQVKSPQPLPFQPKVRLDELPVGMWSTADLVLHHGTRRNLIQYVAGRIAEPCASFIAVQMNYWRNNLDDRQGHQILHQATMDLHYSLAEAIGLAKEAQMISPEQRENRDGAYHKLLDACEHAIADIQDPEKMIFPDRVAADVLTLSPGNFFGLLYAEDGSPLVAAPNLSSERSIRWHLEQGNSVDADLLVQYPNLALEFGI